MRRWSSLFASMVALATAADVVAADVTPPAPAPPPPAAAATNDAGLPLPPSIEPRAYEAWLRALPRATQRAVDRYCRKHPRELDETCGGIGPLHIPMPPAIGPAAKGAEPTASAVGQPRGLVARPQPGAAPLRPSVLPGRGRAVHRPVRRDAAGGRARRSRDPLHRGRPVRLPARRPGRDRLADRDHAVDRARPRSRRRDHQRRRAVRRQHRAAERRRRPPRLRGARRPRRNGDRRLDAADPAFADLLLWADRDGDRRSAPDELTPLAATLPWLPIEHQREPRCDARGNCERERATMTWDAGGQRRAATIVDVYLRIR